MILSKIRKLQQKGILNRSRSAQNVRVNMKISLVSWNCLADSYAFSQVLPSESMQHIEWNTRKKKIASSLESCEADILCLQEVDHYTDFYQPLLSELGYNLVYCKRPSRQDGCLIAYDSKKYELHKHEMVQFDDIADLMENDSARSNMKRSNVALIALLSCKNSDKKFISSTAHMYWNPRRPEVKSLQTQYLVSRIDNFIAAEGLEKETPVIMAGDFNSVPFSEPYQLLIDGFDTLSLKKGMLGLQNVKDSLYGPNTKFLCDRNLSRLCRWMRLLGIDTTLVADVNSDISTGVGISDNSNSVNGGTIVRTSPKIYKKNKQTFEHIFSKARDEQRVILTTSRTMRERSMCPPSFLVSTRDLEAALVEVCKEYGLILNQSKFLTVCGKCGGEIEKCEHSDPRVSKNCAVPPTDREVFICKDCFQPYWWNERENSSPARAMKMADKLFSALKKELNDENIGSKINEDDTDLATSEIITKRQEERRKQEIDDEISLELSERLATALEFRKPEAIKKEPEEPELKENTTTDDISLTELFVKRDQTILLKSKEISNPNGEITEELPDCISTLSRDKDDIAREITSNSTGRTFSSAYAVVHNGKEPETTNWSIDFKDTLDYVFVSKEIKVLGAKTIPLLKAVIDEEIIQEAGITISNQDNESKDIEANRKFLSLIVDSPQPSDLWPSDHFMVHVNLTL